MLKTKNEESRCIYDLFQNICDFVFEVNKDGIIRRVLVRDQSIMPDAEKLIGQSVSTFIIPEMVEQCLEVIRTTLAKRENGFMEYTTVADSGIRTKYEVRVVPVFPAPGHCVILVENVTHRSSLELMDDRWKMALDAVGDGMWDLDIAHGTIFFTDKWYDLMGYPPFGVPITYEAWNALMHPDDLMPAGEAFEAYLRGESSCFVVEARYKIASGEYRWMLSRGIVVGSDAQGRPTRLIGTHTDIHDRKLAEEQLQASMDTFASAFRYSANGMALVGIDGQWLDVNEATCQMIGYGKEELLKLRFQDITHPDDLATDLKLIKVLLDKKIDKYDLEKRYITKAGTVVWTLLTVSLVWNTDGSPRFFISQIMDITARKVLADELVRKNRELDEARLSLEKKVKQLEEMNHIIGHNLRGPANNLKMLIGAMKGHEGLPTEDNSTLLHQVLDREEILTLMEKSSKAQLGTLDTLMQLTQIGLNKNIPFEDCDIEEAAQDVVHQLQAIVAQKKANIRLDMGVKKLRYPRVYLDSILYNLVSNALKYSRAEETPEIVISTSKQKSRSCISVKDNGLGIDLALHGHRMFKLNQVFHKGHDSKGVGLFITKAQIEALGGSIEVDSQPNVGTEFKVTI